MANDETSVPESGVARTPADTEAPNIVPNVEVAIDAKVFAPVAYRRPEAAEMLEEVAMPPNVIAPPPPRTVCAEQICGQVHVSDEVATPYTPAAPLETRRLDDEG